MRKHGDGAPAWEAGTYEAEWHDLTTRETRRANRVTVEGDVPLSFAAPFAAAGPSVLHLKRIGG